MNQLITDFLKKFRFENPKTWMITIAIVGILNFLVTEVITIDSPIFVKVVQVVSVIWAVLSNPNLGDNSGGGTNGGLPPTGPNAPPDTLGFKYTPTSKLGFGYNQN